MNKSVNSICIDVRHHITWLNSPSDRVQFREQQQNFPTTLIRKVSTANSFPADSFSLHATTWFRVAPNSVPHRHKWWFADPFPLKRTQRIWANGKSLRQSPSEMWLDCLSSIGKSCRARNIYLKFNHMKLTHKIESKPFGWLTAAEIDGAILHIQRIQNKVHVAFDDNRCAAMEMGFIFLRINWNQFENQMVIPETEDQCTVPIQAQTGDLFEQRQHLHFANLSYVQIGHLWTMSMYRNSISSNKIISEFRWLQSSRRQSSHP